MHTEYPPRWADDAASEDIDVHFCLHFDQPSIARYQPPRRFPWELVIAAGLGALIGGLCVLT